MKLKNWVGIFIVIICVVGFLQLCPFSIQSHDYKKIEKSQQVMKQLSKQDIAAINSQIQTIQDKFKLASVDTGSFSARFANTIIIGDSLSSGLIEYGIMPSDLVMAERGKRTDNIDDFIQRTIQYAPKAVFMQFGINDLPYCRGNSERFASQYEEQIVKLQKGLPNAKIYINSLTPISKQAQAENEAYTHVAEFNSALQQLCKKLKVTYIDNTQLINFEGDVYEFDGVHPYYPYYPIWLSHMLDVAGY